MRVSDLPFDKYTKQKQKVPDTGNFLFFISLIMLPFPVHSPVQKIIHPDFASVSLSVKRDDLIHPFISGNKWRKLKYTLEAAIIQKKNHLVTFGGSYSNHLLATACAAAQFGFKSTGIVRGEAYMPPNDMLFLCELFGMQLIYTDRESYRNKRDLYEEYFQDNSESYFIDEGGASAEGQQGCAELINELQEVYDRIILACGTATTALGIIQGCEKHQLNTFIDAIAIHRNDRSLRQFLQSNTTYGHWTIHKDFHCGGYAKTNSELIEFCIGFSRQTGILIEPVYTGKALLALKKLIAGNHINTNEKILFIHTGGLHGIFGKKQAFYTELKK